METYENPQKCHCYTCKHFQTDVAYSNGKPCRLASVAKNERKRNPMTKSKHICPHCGGDLTEFVSGLQAERGKTGGSKRTEAKLNAQRDNMAKLNAAYTPEKRKAAAAKRLETLRKKAGLLKSGL